MNAIRSTMKTRGSKTTKLKRGTDATAARSGDSSVSHLKEQLDLCTRELNEAQTKLDLRTRELTESLEYRTATADILRVISSSPTDVHPVFDTIAENAVRLCNGQFSFVLRFAGKLLHFAGCHGLNAEGLETFQRLLPRPAGEETVSGRAILCRDVAQIPDVQADSTYGTLSLAQAVNYRSVVAVPLLHDGDPIGAIAVARANAGSPSVRSRCCGPSPTRP